MDSRPAEHLAGDGSSTPGLTEDRQAVGSLPPSPGGSLDDELSKDV